MRATLKRFLLAGPETGRWANAAWAGRVVSGAVFVVFGLGKFVNHATEADSFRTYGLPAPDAFVYLIGGIEVLGGLLLIAGLATRLAAAILAGNMIGAITLSGIAEGEIISLTLAPALLVVMLLLIAIGPGRHALDRRAWQGLLGPASRVGRQ
jgi:putative oxidoreductase